MPLRLLRALIGNVSTLDQDISAASSAIRCGYLKD